MRLIDAEELMIKLQWHCDLNCPYTEKERDVMCNACFLGDAKDYIDSMPTLEVKPTPHGHWIYREYGYPLAHNFYTCSVCGSSRGLNIDNYCPNCGACMDGISNDNETSNSVYESIKQGLEDAINGDVRKSEISNG